MSLGHGPTIVRDGLVLHLDAANPKSYPGTGSTWYDLTRNGNDGALLDGTFYSNINLGSMTFDGVDDSVNVEDSVSLNVQSSLTLSAWVRLEILEDNLYPCVFRKGHGYNSSGSTTDQYGLWLWRGGLSASGVGFRIVDTTDTMRSINSNIDNNNIINKWIMITATYQSGNGTKMRIFYDSVLVREVNFDGNYQIKTTNGSLRIGNMNNFSMPFGGQISCSMLYNRSLSPTEIQQNFNALRGRFGI